MSTMILDTTAVVLVGTVLVVTPVFQHADKDLYCFSGSCTKFTYSCSARAKILMSFFCMNM